MKTETLIVGGGLSGLYAATRLFQQSRDFLLFEGRDRLGGRILSESPRQPDAPSQPKGYDLGPTWFWPDQPRMARLLTELGLESFEQYSAGASRYEDPQRGAETFKNPGMSPVSLRVSGGMARVIDALADRLPSDRLRLSSKVTKIAKSGANLTVSIQNGDELHVIEAERVLLALPPRLALRSIDFTPALPTDLRDALIAIPTWMAGHAKVVAVYDRPFWRAQGLSGHGFSHIGPAMEIHDASQPDGPGALFGFLGIPAEQRRSIEAETLRSAAIAQFVRLFGPDAAQPSAVFLKDWINDPLTATTDDLAPLYSHPHYGLPRAAQNVWDGQLVFCATEAASHQGGFLEGALVAAEEATPEPAL